MRDGVTDAARPVAGQERTRPRVEGPREGQILDAALSLLQEVGYDRLTMDAVAQAARAGKATLYRRWQSKAELVVDAAARVKGFPDPPAGTDLRSDLLAMACGPGGLTDTASTALLAALITAMHRDAELAGVFQRRFVGPRMAIVREVMHRAADRGELGPQVDVDLLANILPALVCHQILVLGRQPDLQYVEQVLDQVVLPACRAGLPGPT